MQFRSKTAYQWNLKSINVLKAWQFANGEGVIVAVIDSGITFGEDLDPARFVPGYDFINNQEISTVETSRDYHKYNHGTHTASIFAQTTNNKHGFAGIAFLTKLMPLRVVGNMAVSSGVESENIVKAIQYAIDKKVDIINLSLNIKGNLTDTSQSSLGINKIEQAIRNANEEGIVVVMAAGNRGQTAVLFPNLGESELIEVGAYDREEKVTSYSNYGENVDIYAPGGILEKESGCEQLPISEIPKAPLLGGVSQLITRRFANKEKEDKWEVCTGTSSAAPHFTGGASLVKSIFKLKGIQSSEIVKQILLRPVKLNSGRKLLDVGQATEFTHQLVSSNEEKKNLSDEQSSQLNIFTTGLLSTGRKFHEKERRFREALRIYQDLENLNSNPPKAKDWNDLCWDATFYYELKRKREEIRKTLAACDKAVELLEKKASKESTNDDDRYYYYWYLDTRAIARYLAGDVRGSISDLEKFVPHEKELTEEAKPQAGERICGIQPEQSRGDWLKKIRRGENPFTSQVLEVLLKQNC
jgi:hypothetical protein